MQTSPRVSVIVPVFNQAATLSFMLEALAGQSVSSREREIIVVDNGSNDGVSRSRTVPCSLSPTPTVCPSRPG